MEFLALNLRIHPGKFGTEKSWDQGDPVPSFLPVLLSPTEPTSGGTVKENAYTL